MILLLKLLVIQIVNGSQLAGVPFIKVGNEIEASVKFRSLVEAAVFDNNGSERLASRLWIEVPKIIPIKVTFQEGVENRTRTRFTRHEVTHSEAFGVSRMTPVFERVHTNEPINLRSYFYCGSLSEVLNKDSNSHRVALVGLMRVNQTKIRPQLQSVGFSCNIIGFLGTIQREASLNDGDEQSEYAYTGDPNSPLCPKCAVFPGLSRAPLGAKIALVSPFWLFAWFAIFEGLGVGIRIDGRFKLKWFVSGVAVGLVPFFAGFI